MLCYAMLYSTLLYSTLLYSTLLYSTLLYQLFARRCPDGTQFGLPTPGGISRVSTTPKRSDMTNDGRADVCTGGCCLFLLWLYVLASYIALFRVDGWVYRCTDACLRLRTCASTHPRAPCIFVPTPRPRRIVDRCRQKPPPPRSPAPHLFAGREKGGTGRAREHNHDNHNNSNTTCHTYIYIYTKVTPGHLLRHFRATLNCFR